LILGRASFHLFPYTSPLRATSSVSPGGVGYGRQYWRLVRIPVFIEKNAGFNLSCVVHRLALNPTEQRVEHASWVLPAGLQVKVGVIGDDIGEPLEYIALGDPTGLILLNVLKPFHRLRKLLRVRIEL